MKSPLKHPGVQLFLGMTLFAALVYGLYLAVGFSEYWLVGAGVIALGAAVYSALTSKPFKGKVLTLRRRTMPPKGPAAPA